jgi:hypothetical protein
VAGKGIGTAKVKPAEYSAMVREIESRLSPNMLDVEIEDRLEHLRKNMTENQRMFVKIYTAVGNTADTRRKFIELRGSAPEKLETLKLKPEVAEAILLERMLVFRRLDMSPERVMEDISVIALSNIAEYCDVVDGELIMKDWSEIPFPLKAAIKSVQQTKYGIKIELYDKTQALYKLAEAAGIFKPDGIEAELKSLITRIVKDAMTIDTVIDGEFEEITDKFIEQQMEEGNENKV